MTFTVNSSGLRALPELRRTLAQPLHGGHGAPPCPVRYRKPRSAEFSVDMLLDLLKSGLATTKRERMVAGGRQTDFARVQIHGSGPASARKDVQVTLMRKPSCLISCSHWLPDVAPQLKRE